MQQVSFLLLVTVFSVSVAAGQDSWPRFRGRQADGVADNHPGLPETWSTAENVLWVQDIPGWGWSCPIVTKDRVFVTSVISDEEQRSPNKGLYLGEGVREPAVGIHHWMVYCFDLNHGNQLWKHEAHTGRPQVPRHPKSTYASETPATDGNHLFVLFGDLGLYCYDLNGKLQWSNPITPKKTFFDYGAAASPVVHDDQVFVVYDNLEESWIAAFDTASGQQRWRKTRDEERSWATPFVWENELRTEIVVPGQRRNRSYGLNGQLLWEFDGRMSNLVIPSPFAAHGLCYIGSGYVGDQHRPTFAVRPGASGSIAADGNFADSPYIAWYQGQSSSYNPSQIVYGDYLYTLYDRGFLTCLEAKTGVEVYGKQRFSPRGSFTASPWAYNDKLFFLSEDGLTYVVKPGSKFEIVGTNDLDELCLASPAIVNDKLLIRTASKLYCLTKGAEIDAASQADLKPRRPSSSSNDIWSAVMDGDQEKVVQLLENGTSIDARQPGYDMTPLNTAVLFGQRDLVILLLDRGADPSLGNKDGSTPLHIAAFLADLETIGMLLTKGASVNAKNRQGQTPLELIQTKWTPELEATYESMDSLLGIAINLDDIRRKRPQAIELLRRRSSDQP
jgi:outer membrane protein assembly factor BamB